jgi:hypothetical protein
MFAFNKRLIPADKLIFNFPSSPCALDGFIDTRLMNTKKGDFVKIFHVLFF